MALLMGVSGTRGVIGRTMTPTLAAELGAAFGTHLDGGAVVVGRDSRQSGTMVRFATVSGLLSCGCDVIDLGIVTTPGTAIMVRQREAAGGVVITASHNPAVWNGIKFLSSEGFAPPPETARSILDRYHNKDFRYAAVAGLGRVTTDDTTHERHVARVLAIVDMDAIRRRGFKVVLDSVNGAGGAGGRKLLERLGCRVVHVNAEPTGRFPHEPEPIEENLTGLCRAVREHDADVGFAQDPDADRCAVVDDAGGYIGEEFTLALAARHVFATRGGPAATNLSTSRMIDDLAQAAGAGPVYRTPVGEANVARAVLDRGCTIGGEGNGGVIEPRVVPVRDSFVSMALVLNLMAAEGRPLCEIICDMPHYVMTKQKFELDRERVALWLDRVRTIVGDGRLNDVDGLRIDWPEGWVHVRPSNTEPVARVIAEARNSETAAALAARVTDLL
ncbi:MAG: phosphoglucosamine mutase [Phycisphaerae bacterium]